MENSSEISQISFVSEYLEETTDIELEELDCGDEETYLYYGCFPFACKNDI